MTEVSVSDLRSHGGRVLDQVEAGESVTITRDGKPVAQLAPLPRQRLGASALVERFSHLPELDPQQLRDEIDQLLNQEL